MSAISQDWTNFPSLLFGQAWPCLNYKLSPNTEDDEIDEIDGIDETDQISPLMITHLLSTLYCLYVQLSNSKAD